MTNNDSRYPRVLPAGDAALTVEFGDRIEPEIHDQVLAFAEHVPALQLPGILEVVPTYRSVTVYIDPLIAEIVPLIQRLAAMAAISTARASVEGRIIEVPVLYGDEFGPDLSAVAEYAKRSREEVITLHSSREYRCYLLGFSPGFPYLGRVPDAIAMPRLSEPRAQVPAGSVGIAGVQTGIYPQATPGGWRLIGRTPIKIYDPVRSQPFLIRPGDRVRFVPISRDQFGEIAAKGARQEAWGERYPRV